MGPQANSLFSQSGVLSVFQSFSSVTGYSIYGRQEIKRVFVDKSLQLALGKRRAFIFKEYTAIGGLKMQAVRFASLSPPQFETQNCRLLTFVNSLNNK